MRSSKLTTLLYTYILFVSVWFFFWLIIGDGPWWLTTLNRVVPQLFLPVLLFLAGLVRKQQYSFTTLLILPVSIFAFLYHPYILPKFTRPVVSGDDLTVMTYNVLYTNFDFDAIANVIRTHSPDLVALQEVPPEMLGPLKDRLAAEYPYTFYQIYEGFVTAVVLSRYPLAEEQIVDLGGDRLAVIVRAQVNDHRITFVAVHLMAYGLQWVRPLTNIPQEIVRRTNAQNHQVELLWEQLQKEPGPVIIGCDCNSKETSSSYRMLDRWFDSAAYQVGWQIPGLKRPGARQDTNLQHIDFVWYRGALEPVAAYSITDTGGSDHRPVLAIFDLR